MEGQVWVFPCPVYVAYSLHGTGQVPGVGGVMPDGIVFGNDVKGRL